MASSVPVKTMVLPASGEWPGGAGASESLTRISAFEIVEHLAVMLFGEKADDVGGRVLADAVDVVQLAPGLAVVVVRRRSSPCAMR